MVLKEIIAIVSVIIVLIFSIIVALAFQDWSTKVFSCILDNPDKVYCLEIAIKEHPEVKSAEEFAENCKELNSECAKQIAVEVVVNKAETNIEK